MTNERMKIASTLWKNGFNCEIVYKKNPKPNKQLEYALNKGIPFVIFIGPQEIQEGKFKIKSLKSETETTHPMEALNDIELLTTLVKGPDGMI